MIIFKKHIFFFFYALLIISACNPARKLPTGQYLLVKNTMTVANKSIDPDELKSYLKQKPNRKQLWTYIRVRLYNAANKGKQTKVNKWIKNTLGSEPVILDTNLCDNSVKQLRMYLTNKGYFNSVVKREIHYKIQNKKAIVHYFVQPATPYSIRNIYYSISDPTLDAFVISDKPRSLLKSGDQYDADNMAAERDRIAAYLNNLGYYYFSADFIKYRIDTSLNKHQLDIGIEISDPLMPDKIKPDSLVREPHKRYYINNIFILVDNNVIAGDTVKYDTLRVQVPNRKKNEPPKTYFFVYNDKRKIKPKTITQQIFVDSGDFYRNRDTEKSHKQLYDLRVFRYVNILFEDLQTTSGPALLNCKINLSRLPIQAVAVETQVTNRGGNLGTSASLVYENRNLFRGAEVFHFKLNGAVEIEKLSFNTKKEDRAIEKIPFFNTIEVGTEMNLRVPKFLMPVRQEKFSKNFRPKTNITLGFNYQQRPDFTRYVSKASFGYEWKESFAKTHLLTPFEINSVIIYPDSAFSLLIDAMPDKITQNTYRDHIISSIKYSYIYNTQSMGQPQNFMYFRGNLEIAGFMFWALNAIRDKQGAYSLFNIPYSQYIRLDLDYRYYAYFHGQNAIATRAAIGFGAPLTKKNTLPFEKYFYLGGSNSMRGWRLRSLGPGSYNESDTLRVDNIGDIGLEMNFEYRFPIYKYFKGGLFIDAGNVWLRKKNDLYPNGEFRFDRFYNEIAFDAGLGLRLDFGFFLIRIDGAIPLKNPRLPEGNRWVFQNKDKIKILGNLGIGYPF